MNRLGLYCVGCWIWVLAGCGSKAGGGFLDTADTAVLDTAVAPGVDRDEDGFGPDEGDCDDRDPERHPDAEEVCNGVDDDCNDVVDDGFPDTDDDGTADCIDEEECDGLDNDGDGEIDEDFDIDGDGLADCLEETDCNGEDDDGDGVVDDGFDADGDGYTSCGDADTDPDCKDDDPEIHPGALDLEDGLDNDCDRLIDEDLWEPGDLVITEIMANPDKVSDTFGEWFEITNVSGRSVILNGIEIVSGSERHTIESADRIVLDPEALYVFGASDLPTRNGNVPVDYGYRDVTMTDTVDSLALLIEALVIDEVAWNEARGWTVDVGATWSLDPMFTDGFLNDVPDRWCAGVAPWAIDADLGTPGGENAPCSGFDHDADGFSTDDGDCDDDDPDVYPGAPEVDVGVDNDCDGIAATIPVAWADYDATTSSLSTCDTLQLDGTRSYDLDGETLSYSWTVDTVPEGSITSTDSLVTATDTSPTFDPDVSGSYTFSLTVNDGALTSAESRLTLPITDPPIPDVDPGADQSHTDEVVCDGEPAVPGETTCPVCDAVTFTLAGVVPADVTGFYWELVSEWPYVSIDDSSSTTPHITVWGLQPLVGESATATAEVFLRATDCVGRTTSASVTLDVSCAGEAESTEDTGSPDTGSPDTGSSDTGT